MSSSSEVLFWTYTWVTYHETPFTSYYEADIGNRSLCEKLETVDEFVSIEVYPWSM